MNRPPPAAAEEDPEMTNISNAINTYTGGTLPPPQEPPRTFVIECNKALAQQDGNINNPNEWTNTFPSVKLKKGDIVSVNSAFLNSRGAGDFLQFDDSNNKARVVFEYYGINDNTNNKRPAYNIKGTDTSVKVTSQGKQVVMSFPPITAVPGLNMNCYPVNYRPMPLYRLMKTYDKYLSNTTNAPNPAAGPNGIPKDGADLIPFTNPTSATYQTTLLEPNWGYQNSPKEIVDNIEDNYVPGLYRHPIVNVRETVLADSSVSGGLFNNSGQARIWYISTQKSALSPCSTDASMRIHFIGNHTGGTGQEYTDSLSFVKSLRPGQYVKFIHPEILFGFGSYAPKNYKAGEGVSTYGSQCYVCTGYKADGNGHNANVDRFTQNGKFGLGGGANSYASLFNPMGMFMKVVRTYFNANTGATQGQGSNTVNPGWLTSCPFIEVACAGSFSCAFGNPNAFTSLQGYGVGAPFAGVPGAYNPATLTAASPIPVDIAASPPTSIVMRTWTCTNNSTWIENVPFGETATRANVVHANFFPQDNTHSEDWYVGYIPRTILGPDLLKAGCQMSTKENALQGADGAWNNMSVSRENYYEKTRGTATEYPVITPINYNLLALNKDGLLSSADGDQTKLKYGKDYESTGLYAGGRLPEVWRPGNNIDEYDDGTNYFKVTKLASYGYGQSFNLQAQDNRTYRTGWAGDTVLNKSNRKGFLNARGMDMNSKFPVNNQQINQTNSLYIINQHLNTTKFWFGFDIDNQNVFTEPPYLNALTQGLAKASHGEWVKGTENFVVAVGDVVTPSTMEKGDKAKGDLCYGNWTSGGWTYVSPILWNARDPPNPPTGELDPNVTVDNFPSATSDNFYVSGANPGQFQNQNPTKVGRPDFTESKIKGTNNGQTMVDGGLFDLRTIFANYGEMGYARFVNQAGESEIMYINVIAHERRENPDVGYFANVLPNDNNIEINGQNMSYNVKPVNVDDRSFYPGYPAVEDPVQNFIAPRFFVLQRDCLNTGKKSFKGSWATTFGNKPTKDDITSELSYFEWLNDMADIEYQFKVENNKRELLPLSSISAGAEWEYKRRFGLNPAVPATDLGAGGDFILTKTLNQPYIKENITYMTDNCLWLHDECVVQGNPATFPKNDTSATGESIMAGHTGDLSWEIHYDYIDLYLDPDVYYYSVTDVANEITKQLHQPKDLYISNEKGGNKPGGTFVGSAGRYPCNQLFRPIHGPSLTQEDVGGDPDPNNPQPAEYGNNEDPSSGYLNGKYTEGDFIFFINSQDQFFKNFYHANKWSLNNNATPGLYHGDQSVGDGIFPVWINNGQIRRNLAPTTNAFTRSDWTLVNTWENLRILYNGDNYETDSSNHVTIRNYAWDNVKCGQFIGTSSPSLTFNPDNSRFEWQNFHQSLYSPTQKSGQGGGDIITNVWTQAIKGLDVWDRSGGINVINWCAPIVEFGATSNRREVQSFDVLTEEDVVGSAFMTKLGFNSLFRSNNSGSTTYPEDVGRKYPGYLPKGTTRSDYDISQAITYGVESQYHYSVIDKSYDTTGAQTNFRNTNFNGVATNALGEPMEPQSKWWGAGATPTKLDAWAGEYLGYNMGATAGTPPDWQLDKLTGGTDLIEINPNDIKLPYMSIAASSSTLTANVLPSKTDEGYFFIMSNIIDKHEFYGSANGGMPLNCIGILSKNYSNTDYFFSFQSPVEFYIKHDKVLTSITTRILTPSMKTPGGLNVNSSVIYSITRPQNTPEPDVPPIALQQMYDYALMDAIDDQIGMGGAMGGATGVGLGQGSGVGTAGGGSSSTGEGARRSRQTLGLQLNQLRQNLVQSALFPQPNAEVQAGMMMSEMGDTLSRMSIHARTQAVLGEQVGDPTLNPMITPRGLVGIDAAPLVPLDTMPSMIQPSLMEEMAAHQIAGKKADADQPATTSPIDYGQAAPAYRNVHFPDEDEDDRNLMNEWSSDPPAYKSQDNTPTIKMPQIPETEDPEAISPSWMSLSPREKTAEKTFRDRFKNIGSSIMPQRRGQKGKKGQFDFEIKQASTEQPQLPSGPMRPMPLQEWFMKFRSQQSDGFNRALNNQNKKGRNIIDDPTSWNMDFLKKMDMAVTNDNWNTSIGGQVNPRDIGSFSAELKARAQHKEQLGSKQTPRAPRPEYPTPLTARAKGREAPYIGAPGKLSLYEAISRTTKHPTRVVRDETHEASDWYLDSSKNLDNKEKKKSNQSHGNENPFDIKTWSKPRLESYSANPFFSIKKKNVKEANTMDKVTKGGMGLIDAEIKARNTGGKRILHTVSKKGADGTKVKNIGYKQGTAPPQYTTPERAHEAPRGVGGASIRPPTIEVKASEGIASGS